MNKFRIVFKTLFLASAFAISAFAEDKDTAFVPFTVNVEAVATARLDGSKKFEQPVRAGYTDTLLIIVEGDPLLARPGKTPNPVTMYSSRGRISLELSQQFRNADIALYSLNGKQVLRGSGEHPNLAMGVYLLSVKGENGSAFTARFAHSGGGLNIDVGFGNGNSGSLLEKAISGNWTITVSAEGYLDTLYAFFPETGRGSTPMQIITLRQILLSSSSSEVVPSSSSSVQTEPLVCATVPASGYATRPITPPALTCGNGATATGISWLGPTISWSNPKDGTYSNISAMANCGTATNLIASCPGTLVVQPVVSCSMAGTGYEGTAITPALACSDGSVPFDIVFSGYLPDFDNPVPGSYAVFAEANCGFGVLPPTSCGTLTVSCTGNSNTSTHYCSNGTKKAYGFVTYNEQTYKTVVIGTQTWMAENLNYNPGTGNSACYNNQPSNCTAYGRLYDWSTAMGVCPAGWHLPSDAEWTTLTNYVSGSGEAGTKLKATTGWNGNSNGTDEYGFSALPGGSGNGGSWWSATEYNSGYAWYRSMYYDDSGVGRLSSTKSYLFSVRCLKD